MIHTRTIVWPATALALLLSLPALAASPHLAANFASSPADALAAKLEEGPCFAIQTDGTPAARWQFSGTAAETTAADPATGLAFRQQRRKLPGTGLLLLDSMLTNRGKAPVRLADVRLLDLAFRIADDQGSSRYRPLTYRNDTWYESTYWTGPDWTRVGRNWHHPGINTPSVRRWTAPRGGRVVVAGRVHKAHLDGDGIRAFIRHGAKTLWQAELDGKDAKGKEHKLTLEVRRGDAIRFGVHKRGRIFCDTTYWDPVVTYEGGEASQASKAFSTTRQGEGGWSYEMETGAQDKLGLPSVHVLGRDLALRDATPRVGQPFLCTAADCLPIFVLADGTDQTGMVAAACGTGPWRFAADLGKDGRLRVVLSVGDEKGMSVAPGQQVVLPRLVLGAYAGQWASGVAALQRVLASHRAETRDLAAQLADAFRRATGSGNVSELDLLLMVQDDWRQQDKLDGGASAYAAACTKHLAKARELLARLRADHGADFLAAEGKQLDAIAARLGPDKARKLYVQLRWLKRRIVLANPQMQFGPLLFCKRVPTSYSHLVMQYYGWRARPGGGLFVLDKPGQSLATRRVFDASEGCILEPRLSYHAKKIVFSHVHCPKGPLPYGPLLNDKDEGFYHLWEVGTDGTGLRQLTRGPYDDLMPTWLPDGGIAFSSTRRKGYARCFGGQFSRRWHVYTLHRCDADGGNIRTVSFHDTNEWFPAVSNTGHILYARWDYIDRDAVTHQNLWATRPDGTNPVALWGNATPRPHCTFQMQPVPNSSKIIFAASAHHSIAGGPICLVDPTKHDNDQAAITRITPEIPFPEAESRNIREYYTAPWPLSEDFYLVAYSPQPLVWEPRANPANALGIYTLDRWGNRELLYRDPAIGATNPCPLVPRAVPPILPQVEEHAQAHGEMVLLDVYQGLGDVPRGTIKQLRIVQIFPKITNVANHPPIGIAGEENGRAALGTVPVEADGSARFRLPARTPVLFQALDADGFAYQTMRSLTYVQPGERTSCIGCHEHRGTSPANVDALALRRPASAITPGPLGGRPFSYVRVVQPVLDKHCAKCHSGPKAKKGILLTGEPHGAFTRSYVSLMSAKGMVPRYKARDQMQVTPPGGHNAARGSKWLAMLRKGHNKVKLSAAELRRLAMWIDLNAIFYGVNLPEDQAKQRRGELVAMPDVQ